MLRDLHNEDQLGMILGHEIAHAIMDHSVSKKWLINLSLGNMEWSVTIVPSA